MTNFTFCYCNERRFNPKTHSPFLALLLLFLLLLLLPRVLCGFFVSFFFFYFGVHGLHQARLFSLEGKMTSQPFQAGQREEKCTVRSSCIAAAIRHCRLDLQGLYGFLFKKKFVPFFSLLQASSNLSDPPRFLMPSSVPGSAPRLKPLCRRERTLMDFGIRGNPL